MTMYRFRAEALLDIDRLRWRLCAAGIEFTMAQVHRLFGDWQAALKVDLTIEQVREHMRHVPDGHVMVQTVAYSAHYTGERNFDVPTAPQGK